MNKLEVQRVSKGFADKQVLEDVSITLKEGELVCLLGVSGGGKTDPTVYHVANFVDAVRANDPSKANSGADDGVKSTFLALSANVSQLSRSVIDIDPSNGKLLTKAGEEFWSRKYEKGWELA